MTDILEHEFPRHEPIEDIADWSENFCLSSFDREQGIAIWLHLGRWRKDLRMWRETMILALPDGNILAHRGYGNRLALASGPGGNALSFSIDEPGRVISACFRGGAVRSSSQALVSGLLPSASMEPVAFDLRFESRNPLWDLHADGNTQSDFMAGLHLEQIGRISGRLTISGRDFAYRGMATRDHSRGVRQMAGLLRHHWVQASFEDGTAILIFDVEMKGEPHPAFSKAAICKDGKLHEARVRIPFRISSLDEKDACVEFQIESALGAMVVQRTEPRNCWAFTTTHPNDMYIGVHGDPKVMRVMLEQPSLFMLDDRIAGFGNVERTIPGTVIDESGEAPVTGAITPVQ